MNDPVHPRNEQALASFALALGITAAIGITGSVAFFAVVLVALLSCAGFMVYDSSNHVADQRVAVGERAVVSLDVPAGDAWSVRVRVDAEVLGTGVEAPDWSLDGEVVIDGVTFPLHVAPGKPPTPGLPPWEPTSTNPGPGSAYVVGSVLVGAVPPEDVDRNVVIEVELRASGPVDHVTLDLEVRD